MTAAAGLCNDRRTVTDEPNGFRIPLPESGWGARDASRIGGDREDDSRRFERDRARAMLDLEEGRGEVPLLDDAGIAAELRKATQIAVIGASDHPGRPSHGVFRFLLDHGFDAVPVNPNARDVLGVPAFRSLAEAVATTGAFDIVDVFRRSELCVPHAREAVGAGASCLWLQLGVVNWEAARIANEGGLSVVMDRCTAIEWRRLAPDRPDVSP